MLMLNGYQYRFVHVQDPPFPYGFGVDDPDFEYWVVPPYRKDAIVYRRQYANPETAEWEIVPEEELPVLYFLARFLGSLHLICLPNYLQSLLSDTDDEQSSHKPPLFVVAINCDAIFRP